MLRLKWREKVGRETGTALRMSESLSGSEKWAEIIATAAAMARSWGSPGSGRWKSLEAKLCLSCSGARARMLSISSRVVKRGRAASWVSLGSRICTALAVSPEICRPRRAACRSGCNMAEISSPLCHTESGLSGSNWMQ